MPQLLALSEADVAAVLSMPDVLRAVEAGLRAQAEDKVQQPLRAMARGAHGFLGAMPCSIDGVGTGAKLVTFFPANGERGLHTHHALIATFDAQTGVPAALLDGRLITEMRTAATSAIATRALARQGADTVAMLGTGVQARAHLEALRCTGAMRRLRIWGRTPDHVEALRTRAREAGVEATACASAAEACKDADIVCTLTPAREPIVHAADIAPGTHINAVGGSAAVMQELAPELVAKARLFVDTLEGARSEAGDIIAAQRAGLVPAEPEMIRLCDVVAGRDPGRRDGAEITLFKSLGMALEDLSCAAVAVERARAQGRGSRIEI